ncbi:pentatricopeptide repeat-containing protein chloroplastic-like [Gossypium australe]|uniref:Pentatricopeptide repeat-containing protein chloroplastic-like n=1 Tax=Gossypium australe TaxID=47621 RepID=A0A5B6WQ43_9ROSI|nr:pentatricopeptide repeat-containing protein chloroplastic-like [Gossypium australe]
MISLSFPNLSLRHFMIHWERFKDLLRMCPHHEFIEEMEVNNYQWQVTRAKPARGAGVFDVDKVTMLASQETPVMQCNVAGVGMIRQECLHLKCNIEHEQVDFMGNSSRP